MAEQASSCVVESMSRFYLQDFSDCGLRCLHVTTQLTMETRPWKGRGRKKFNCECDLSRLPWLHSTDGEIRSSCTCVRCSGVMTIATQRGPPLEDKGQSLLPPLNIIQTTIIFRLYVILYSIKLLALQEEPRLSGDEVFDTVGVGSHIKAQETAQNKQNPIPVPSGLAETTGRSPLRRG
jgi:hypothetical protein